MASHLIRFADLPDEARQYFQGVYERALVTFQTVIAEHGLKPGIAVAVARARVALLQTELTPVIESLAAAGTPVACARGCACCCTTTVPVSPDEAIALRDELKATLDREAFDAFTARVAAADARGHGIPSVERHQLRIFCPVLDPESGACLGHQVRPVACQGYLSLDVRACQADYEDTPRRIPHPLAANLITRVVDDTRSFVLTEAGYGNASLELTAALAEGLEVQDLEARWIAGEPLFADAPYIPSKPEDIERMARERGETDPG